MNKTAWMKEDLILCNDVSLSLPVRSTRSRYAAKAMVSAFTGGVLKGNHRLAKVSAISNLTLSIKEGERIALIGHNGAGKSTFLRLISGIFTPSSGNMYVKSFATPLIDKSFIIDADLTGFEVCTAHYLKVNGTSAFLKGSKNNDYDDFLKDIFEFSELGEFMGTPVSSYSDGMKTRLMFALITSFPHKLLAMDEGIAAGDRFFMDKANKRFEKFLAYTSTLILASHDEALLKRFTSRGIVFEKGRCVFDGKLVDALDYYHDTKNNYQ